jgi:DNA-binding NarL/FixJ family response regulator
VLVVDDHPAVRAGVEAVLAREPDLEAVATVATPDQAMAAAHGRKPDVAVIDYNLPSGDGLTLARRMKALPKPPGVLIYSAYADAPLSVAAVVAGADGVVDKGGDGDELCRAIRFVAAGRSVRPRVLPSALRTVGERLDPVDVPIFGMLWHRTPPSEIARVMGVTERWLNGRRWAMLRRLTGPGQRGPTAPA